MENTKNENKAAGAPSELNAGLERLRIAAGIELEDSFEAGSKWQVGDRELAELVRLAKKEAREEIAAMAMDDKMEVFIVTKDIDLGVEIKGVFIDRSKALQIVSDGNVKDHKKWVGSDGVQREASGGWDFEIHEVAYHIAV